MSAKKVKVWNENTVDLVEEFKGQTIKIPAGKCIEMGRSQAIQFKGQYRPIQVDGMKQQVKSSMKILRIEPIKKGESKGSEKIPCSLCDKEFTSEQGLKLHTAKAHAGEETFKK